MSITSVSSSTSTSNSGSTTTTTSSSSAANTLQIEFVDLLVAQIKNQDPTSPADASQYVSQLASLSTVQSLEKLTTLQSTSNDEVTSLAALQSTSLVGKKVLAKSDSAVVDSSGTLSGQVTLSSSADSMTAYVYDSSGNLVTSETSSNLASGSYGFNFSKLDAGTYTVAVKTTTGGATSSQTVYLNSTVTSVTLNNKTVTLALSGGGSVSLSDVASVSQS